MISFDFLDSYLQKQGVIAGNSQKEELIVYSINDNIFAYVGKTSKPLRISLRVDEVLIKHLTEEYESVMPGHKLNPNKWLTLVVTGQLDDQSIVDLVNRAIALAKNTND